MIKNGKSLSTKMVHGASGWDVGYNAGKMPIYQTTSFYFETTDQAGEVFSRLDNGFAYGRRGNPTVRALEEEIAALEGAESCAATSSGVGAISTCMWMIASAGGHIITDESLYSGTYELFSLIMSRYGVEVDFIDTSDVEEIRAHIKENTCCLYLETPANPTLKVVDIKAAAAVAHEYDENIMVVVDNTFATPLLQKPIELGADVVLHSATKYLNGHGDVLAGMVCGKKDFIDQVKNPGLMTATGAIMSPQEAFLIQRGLRTMNLRVPVHCNNAMRVAEYLQNNPCVTRVYYPGLESHPGHDVAKRQMKAYGGVLSFEVASREQGSRLLNNLKLCKIAVSLGDVVTLIEHPASMSHEMYTKEELGKSGIPEGLIRLAVGLEDADDIIADLDQAFEAIK